MSNPASTPSENHFYRQVAACMPRCVKHQPRHTNDARTQLNADIDAFLAAGGSITVAESQEVPPALNAFGFVNSMEW